MTTAWKSCRDQEKKWSNVLHAKRKQINETALIEQQNVALFSLPFCQ
jgi:hypothetical protein